MDDHRQFVEYVRETLAHLHDRAFLLGHPLTAMLTVGPDASERPEQLRRLVLEAINDLRERPDAQPGSPLWRGHRLLLLRYVDGVSMEEIARQLGVTDRQARRDHQMAVEAVASVLWTRCRRHQSDDVTPIPTGEKSVAVPNVTEEALLEAEILKLGAARADSPTDAVAVIRGALSTIAPLADRRSLYFRQSFRPRLPSVAMNPAALRHICLSLLSYAIDHTAGDRIDVECEQDDRAVALRISFPVAAAVDERVRAEDDPQLVVPRRLAQLQGGGLALGRSGTKVEMRLALPRAPLTTILVIDDDPDVVRLFRRFLAGRPYHLLQANTGARSLQLARQVQPSVILLDVMMLAEDGWEILNRLKRDPELREIPVVVCSVLRERALAEALGAVEFLHKPVSQQKLLATLERYRTAS